jgi:hypothetical protein
VFIQELAGWVVGRTGQLTGTLGGSVGWKHVDTSSSLSERSLLLLYGVVLFWAFVWHFVFDAFPFRDSHIIA